MLSLPINQVICGDCLDVMKTFPDKSIDLVVTSPPYNMRLRVRNGEYTTKEKAEHFSKKYKHFDDDLPIDEFYRQHSLILSELLRVSKIVCYVIQIVTGSKQAFFKIIGDFSEDIKDIIIWDKGSGEPAIHENILNSSYELILVLEGDKNSGRLISNAKFKRGTMSNILRIGKGKRIHSEHHASFPVQLAGTLIDNFSDSGNVVLDTFNGLGTTAIAAIRNNRYYIGIDISQEYCDLAEERIRLEKQQINMFTEV